MISLSLSEHVGEKDDFQRSLIIFPINTAIWGYT